MQAALNRFTQSTEQNFFWTVYKNEGVAPKEEVHPKIPKRFTRAWVRDNPELFKKLSTPPVDCPVCLQKMQHPRSLSWATILLRVGTSAVAAAG